TAAIGREYSPARGSASIGRGYDPWDMSTSRQQGVRGSGRPASTRNDTKTIEGGNGWRILSVVISGAISPPKLSLQAPRNVPYGLPRFAGCFAPWSDAVPRHVMDLFGGNRLLVSQAFDGSDDAEAVAKAK